MCKPLLHYVEQIQSYEISNFEKHAKISMLTLSVFADSHKWFTPLWVPTVIEI